jgi:hypothetical protein
MYWNNENSYVTHLGRSMFVIACILRDRSIFYMHFNTRHEIWNITLQDSLILLTHENYVVPTAKKKNRTIFTCHKIQTLKTKGSDIIKLLYHLSPIHQIVRRFHISQTIDLCIKLYMLAYLRIPDLFDWLTDLLIMMGWDYVSELRQPTGLLLISQVISVKSHDDDDDSSCQF